MGLLDKLKSAFEAASDLNPVQMALHNPLIEHTPGLKDTAFADSYRHGVDEVVQGVEGIGHDLFVQPWKESQASNDLFIVGAVKAEWHGLKAFAGDTGRVLGGALEAATSPLQSTGVDVPGALNATYDFFDRNLATAELAANLSDRDGFFSGSLFNKGTWDEAENIREQYDLTTGQAFALARMKGDIRDPDAREKFMQGTLYDVISTTTDLTLPVVADPLAVAGKKISVAKVNRIDKPIRAGDIENLPEIAKNSRSMKVKADIEKMIAKNPDGAQAEFYTKYRAQLDPALGPEIAHVLVEATKAGEFDWTIRSLMGDDAARMVNDRYRSVYAARVNRLKGDLDALHAAGRIDKPRGKDFFASPDAASARALQWEIDDITGKLDLLNRTSAQHGLLTQQLRNSTFSGARAALTRSDWYQSSKFATPFRAYYTMRPAAILNVDSPDGYIQVQRMLDHAPLDEAAKNSLLAEYQAAPSGIERTAVVDRAIKTSTMAILDKHGVHPEDAAVILKDQATGLGLSNGILGNRKYDGENRGSFEVVHDGVVTRHHLPIWYTQDANLTTLPDLAALDSKIAAHSPNRPFLQGLTDEQRVSGAARSEALMRIGEAGLQTLQGMWKAGTLLRVAYPIRVVGEEQVRMMGLFGWSAPLIGAKSGVRNMVVDRRIIEAKRQQLIGQFLKDNGRIPTEAEYTAKWDSLLSQDEWKAINKKARTEYREQDLIRGQRNASYLGVQYDPFLFGDGRMYKDMLSSRYGWDKADGRKVTNGVDPVATFVGESYKTKGSGKWESVQYRNEDGSVNPNWKRSWYNAVTRQIARDKAARMIARGDDFDTMLDWTRTAEGKQYLQRLHPYWREHPDRWLEAAFGQVESYLPTPALRQAMLTNKIDWSLVQKEMDGTNPPVVHGEVLAQHLAGHPVAEALNAVTSKMYKALAQAPTEHLTRIPAGDHAYHQFMRRQIEVHSKGGTVEITDADIARYQKAARQHAVQVVKRNFYDLTTESDLAHALRFISPFFGAFQETINTWARIAWNNPSFVLRVHDIWEAPDRAGLTVDANGDERLVIPLFGGFTIPGVGSINSLNLSKKGLNTVLNLPGVGPIGAVPVVEITKNRPDIASSEVVQFFYPYGVPHGVVEAFTPKTFRNGYATYKAFTDANYMDRRYLNQWNAIYAAEHVRFKQGLRSSEPTRQEIDDKAAKMTLMKFVADFIAPTTTTFDDPYQPYREEYRRLEQENPATADQRFYDLHGEEMYQLTGHITRNVAGIPATLPAWEASRKYADLIDEFPELGGVIVGEVGGEFNQAVYQNQLRTAAGGTGLNQRQTLSKQEIIDTPKIELGWLEYRSLSNDLMTELEKRGLTRITDRGAEDIRKTRTAYIENVMKTKFPEWYAKYTQFDPNRMQRRADAFEKIAYDPVMVDRPDMAGMREYLEIRNDFLAELRKRKNAGGSGTLNARSVQNKDMWDVWEGVVSDLVRRNASFAPLWERLFSNDHLEVRG